MVLTNGDIDENSKEPFLAKEKCAEFKDGRTYILLDSEYSLIKRDFTAKVDGTSPIKTSLSLKRPPLPAAELVAAMFKKDWEYTDPILPASLSQSSLSPCIMHRESIHKYRILSFLVKDTASLKVSDKSDNAMPALLFLSVSLVVVMNCVRPQQ